MNKKYLGLLGLLFLGEKVVDAKINPSQEIHHKWRSLGYTGYVWSKNAEVVNPAPLSFENVAPNDSDDGRLSNVPFGGMSLVRRIYDWADLGFSFETYGLFAYQRSHLRTSPIGSSIELLGNNYSRSFTLSHQSAMMEGYLNFPSAWLATLGKTQIRPTIGGGLGIGITNLFDFQTISYDLVHSDTQITTIASNNIKKSFAWRFEIGLIFQTIDSDVSLGINYRYYHGGNFASGTRYQFNDVINEGASHILPPWTGLIKADVLKMSINVDFN